MAEEFGYLVYIFGPVVFAIVNVIGWLGFGRRAGLTEDEASCGFWGSVALVYGGMTIYHLFHSPLWATVIWAGLTGFSAWIAWRFWRRRRRRKLLSRLLGRVVDLGHRLRVVPVPQSR